MDVSSLYTNPFHVCVSGGKKCLFFGNFGVRCFLETLVLKFALLPYYRRSIVIKNLILMILKSNAFRFGNEYYRQITGTAMGTPMAPNYANLSHGHF